MQVNSYYSGYLQRWPGGSLLLHPLRVLAAALLHLGLAVAAGDGADHPGRQPLHVPVQRPQVPPHHEPQETHQLLSVILVTVGPILISVT